MQQTKVKLAAFLVFLASEVFLACDNTDHPLNQMASAIRYDVCVQAAHVRRNLYLICGNNDLAGLTVHPINQKPVRIGQRRFEFGDKNQVIRDRLESAPQALGNALGQLLNHVDLIGAQDAVSLELEVVHYSPRLCGSPLPSNPCDFEMTFSDPKRKPRGFLALVHDTMIEQIAQSVASGVGSMHYPIMSSNRVFLVDKKAPWAQALARQCGRSNLTLNAILGDSLHPEKECIGNAQWTYEFLGCTVNDD